MWVYRIAHVKLAELWDSKKSGDHFKLPETIIHRAMRAANQQGTSLDVYWNEAMRDKLNSSPKSEGKPWLKLGGRLKHLHHENTRINRLIQAEFETVKPEDRDIDPRDTQPRTPPTQMN